jgi:predicted RNase H-like HicB family nuclease
MEEAKGVARDYLRAPYSRVLIPDAETGTYAAKIAEFPGCVAQGDTPEEAYRNLEAVAESWIEEVLGMGQEVPEPAVGNRYSGRVALRLPRSLHRNAAELAEREGTSLNQFLVSAVAEKVGAENMAERVLERIEQRSSEIVWHTPGLVATIPGRLQFVPMRGQPPYWGLDQPEYRLGVPAANPAQTVHAITSNEAGNAFTWERAGFTPFVTGGWITNQESEELSEVE